MINNSAIGVFDSGMGGLTVLKALTRRLPEESFIYLGDTARLPYGTKSAETVTQYALQMTRVLVEQGIKALVIACNTATTAALPTLQTMLPDIPVIGVVEPGAIAAVQSTRSGRILVLATETTVASGAYPKRIQAAYPGADVRMLAAPLLVALAEEGFHDGHIAESVLKHYLATHDDEDTIVLGCTHFPVFHASIENLVKPDVRLVDSGEATAIALEKALSERNLLAISGRSTTKRYLVTDSVARFCKVGERFLGTPLSASDVTLLDATGQPRG